MKQTAAFRVLPSNLQLQERFVPLVEELFWIRIAQCRVSRISHTAATTHHMVLCPVMVYQYMVETMFTL